MRVAGCPDIIFASFVFTAFVAALFFIFRHARSYAVAGAFVSIGLLGVSFWRFSPGSPLLPRGDSGFYFHWGTGLASAMQGESYEYGRQIWPGKGVWPVVIALSHLVVRDAFLVPLVLVIIAAVSSVLVLGYAIWLILGKAYPILLAGIVILQPAFMGWGTTLDREAFFWLGTSLLILGFALYCRERYLGAAIWGAVGAIFVIGIRFEVGIPLAYLMACTALIYVLQTRRNNSQRFSAPFVTAVFGVWLSTTFVAVAGFLAARNPGIPLWSSRSPDAVVAPTAAQTENGFSVAEVLGLVVDRAASTRQSLSKESVTTAFDPGESLVSGALLGVIRTVFGPFPTEIEPSLVYAILVIATLNFVFVLGLAIFYLVAGGPKARALAGLGLAALGVVFIIGVTITNYGMIARFRFGAQLLLIPLAIAGYHLLQQKLSLWREAREVRPGKGP